LQTAFDLYVKRPFHARLTTLWMSRRSGAISSGRSIASPSSSAYVFAWQMDAILFWDRFKGRWLRRSEFHYPKRPADLPILKPLDRWPTFIPHDPR
jgi:hypothetical protein